MSVSQFAAGVDRILSRAHELYPAGDALRPLTSGGTGGGVPSVPAGASGLTAGAPSAAQGYQRSQAQLLTFGFGGFGCGSGGVGQVSFGW